MKKTTTIFLLMMGYSLVAQLPSTATYPFPDKTKGFPQVEWLTIMRDMANDTFILNRMKGFEKGPIVISHLPYVCWVNKEHKIVLQFCPDCNWVITSFEYQDCTTFVSLVSEDYGFALEGVHAGEGWCEGDTVNTLVFLLGSLECKESQNIECVLTPAISKRYIPAYAVFPQKKKKKT